MIFKEKINVDNDKLKLITKCAKVAMFIALYTFFWCNSEFYSQISTIDGISNVDFLKKRIVIVTVICVAGMVISFWEMKFLEKWNKWIVIALVIATPIVSFLTLEYNNIRKSRLLFEVFKGLGRSRSLATLFILTLIMIGIYIISNNVKVAVVGVSVTATVFGLLCYYVFAFRGIPFLASDLSTMGAAMSVMGAYDYSLTYQLFVMILITVFWSVLIMKTKNIVVMKWKLRLGMLGTYIVLVIISIHVMVFTPFLLEKLSVTVNTFQPQKSYGNSGSILTVIRSIQLIMVEKPVGYSVKVVEEIADGYPEIVVQDAVEPNVIIIMNEAFSDLQEINNFKTNKEVIPYFKSLKENVVRGEMYVSGFGGRTANTEFEVLTGLSQAFTPPSSTPYQLFIKDMLPSLTHTLRNRGYQGNIAMHPFGEKGYNRYKVYPLLGFDTFLSKKDFEEVALVRNHVSDEAGFDRIIEEYEAVRATSDKPFYAFNVTMQNHAGYGEDFDNLPRDIEITDSKFKNSDVERYLNLINLSDKALKKLVTYFENQEEPTVVVFYGDHQPKLPEAFYKELLGKSSDELSDDELMEKYKTPFIIWANYDIEEKENIKTSANYMSSLILESTKMQTTRYSQFLSETASQVPVLNVLGYFGADGQFYKTEDEESPYWTVINNYRIMQYNDMFDKGNRIEDFY